MRSLAVVVTAIAVTTTTGCQSSRVEVDSPDLGEADTKVCTALIDALPKAVAGEFRRSVEPEDALGAAWGEPPIVLTCGVEQPSAYEPTDECNAVKGVGWWVPADQQGDPRVNIDAVALSLTPYVELTVPSHYRSKGIDQALADLAPALKKHLAPGKPCL